MKEKKAEIYLGLNRSNGYTQGTIFLLIFCLLVLSITKRNVEVSYYNYRCLFLLSVLPTLALCILKLCLGGNHIQGCYVLVNSLFYQPVCMLSHFSHVQPLQSVRPLWTTAYQTPLFMAFSRQEYWSGWSFSFPEDLPDPGIQPGSRAADSLPLAPPEKPQQPVMYPFILGDFLCYEVYFVLAQYCCYC